MRAFDSFMISVDFWRVPVTFDIAFRLYGEQVGSLDVRYETHLIVVEADSKLILVVLCSQTIGPSAYYFERPLSLIFGRFSRPL